MLSYCLCLVISLALVSWLNLLIPLLIYIRTFIVMWNNLDFQKYMGIWVDFVVIYLFQHPDPHLYASPLSVRSFPFSSSIALLPLNWRALVIVLRMSDATLHNSTHYTKVDLRLSLYYPLFFILFQLQSDLFFWLLMLREIASILYFTFIVFFCQKYQELDCRSKVSFCVVASQWPRRLWRVMHFSYHSLWC